MLFSREAASCCWQLTNLHHRQFVIISWASLVLNDETLLCHGLCGNTPGRKKLDASHVWQTHVSISVYGKTRLLQEFAFEDTAAKSVWVRCDDKFLKLNEVFKRGHIHENLISADSRCFPVLASGGTHFTQNESCLRHSLRRNQKRRTSIMTLCNRRISHSAHPVGCLAWYLHLIVEIWVKSRNLPHILERSSAIRSFSKAEWTPRSEDASGFASWSRSANIS